MTTKLFNFKARWLLVPLVLLTLGVGNAWADTHTLGWGTATGSSGPYTNFTTTSGTVTDIVSFTTAKNSSSSDPAYNSSSKELRLYYNNGGNGGSITLTPASDVTITGFTITTSTSPTTKYKVGNGSLNTITLSSNTGSVTGLSVGSSSSITIQNCNTTNTQLRIKTIKITYTASCTKIGAPTVTATPGDGRIDLSWSNQTGASSYSVTKTPAGGTVGTPSKSGSTWSCAITGLTNGTTYTWSVEAVGSGDYCASGNTAASASATPNVLRTITYYDKDGQHTTSLADGTNIATALTALYGGDDPVSCDATNYEYFVGWKVGEISGTASSVTLLDDEVVNASSPSDNYYAVWSDTDPSAGGWTKVTSISVGDVVVFAYDTDNKEMTGVTTTSTTYGSATTVDPYPDDLSGVYALTVEAGNGGTGYSFKHGSVYLSWSSGNSLTTSGTKDNASSWTISESSSGNFKFANVGTTSRILQYNSGSPRWACYGNSGQSAFQIYKQSAGGDAEYITTCDTDPCASLQAPNVTATATANSITLSWDAVDGATSYNIYNYTTEDLDETTSLTYTFTGLSSETEYEWGVESAKDECFKETRGTTTTSATPYTVTFNAGSGTCDDKSLTEASGGAGVILPSANPPAACATDGWEFAGWWTGSVAETTTSPGELLTAGSNYKPASDCTLYAVYQRTEGVGSTSYVLTAANAVTAGTYVIGITGSSGYYIATGLTGSSDVDMAVNTTSDVTLTNNAFTTLPANGMELTFTGNNTDGFTISNSGGDKLSYSSYENRRLSFDATGKTWKVIEDNFKLVLQSHNSDGYYTISQNGTNSIRGYASDTKYNTLYLFKKTGGSTTTYNSNPTCLEPVWETNAATIDKTELTVNCGERSPMTGQNGAAIISFPTEDIYNFTKDITIEATTGFLVSTNQSMDANYQSSVSLSPLVGTTNANTFYDKHVYVRAEAPAQSNTDLEGTITIKNNKGETLQTFSVTADVTCNKCTVQFVDRGANYQEPILRYAGETINEAPADPEGVCTEPIHYVFDGWAEATVAAGSTTYTKVTFPYTVTGNTQFYAVYRYLDDGGEPSNDFIKVTKEKDDWTGDYVIVDEDAEKAIGNAYQNTNTLTAVDVTIQDNKVVSPSEAVIWQIRKHGENYTMYNASADKYAYIAKADAKGAGLSETTTNTTQDIQIIFNNGTAKVSGVDIYRCFYYYGTNTEWRTYATGSYNTGALYCRSLESYLYTTSPVCGPHLAITEGKEIYVTGGNAGGTRDLVIAQQKVSYKATRLQTSNGLDDGTAPDVKVAANGITVGGEVTEDVKVTIDQTKEQQTDGTYTITGTITVQYQPSANNKQEDIQVQLAVDYNAEARDNFTVHARSLPAEFVIVAKSGDKWYALNGDMNTNAANPANGQVTLDDDANPTKATYAPCNTIYTFDGLPNTGDRTYVRFQGTDGAWLWASSGTNVGIQNNVLKTTPEGNNNAYNWKLYTEDNITYRFGNANSSRQLTLSGEKFGMYASGVQDIRILPYDAKCLYNYAPSNLKVTVLKGTYVTLTWDAVIGATKYQYSTDATNWNDAGTDPTVTINGLTGATEYTYYIRAYHEDAGVSHECIDYAEITFTTANCDDVPTDITYSADMNSIIVSWIANAATSTVNLYSDEEAEELVATQSVASPCTFTDLAKNTQYYVQILANGTCASLIVPVKTKDVEVDIVEWYPQGIIVDINTDETVGVTLENEVSYGSGMGTEATELFFSKYYEASYNVKLVAIYNGTKNIIDLTDYTIRYGKTSWESNYITLKDFGATKGQIQPGEEIILYSYAEKDADDKKILDCVHDAYPDGNWVRVTSSNNDGKGTLSFGGDKTIILCKKEYDDEEDKYYDDIIDVIGALIEDPSEGILPTNTATEKPSWGDSKGWVCETGLYIADDSQIGISTNRCLLIRNNTVTSGDNAVTQNINDFVTLCTEWKGAHVPDNDIDNGVQASCDNFAYVGTFDYSDYYTKYVPMGSEQVFDENARNADGTVTIPITDLYKHACSNIRVKLTNSNDDVLSDREYKVPIMITTDQCTNGQAFLALQENLATKEVDGEGNVINTYPLSLDEVREICKTCDVVVRDNATLTKVTDGTTNDHPQVRNVYVYEGASIVIPDGVNHNYTINGLSLRRKGDVVASAQVQGTGKFVLPADEPVCLDLRVDANNWHWFTLPYDCDIADVTWVDGTPAKYNTDWFLMYYDGESRAASTNPHDNHWKVYNGTTIEAGKGYIVGITGDLTHPNYTFELRFPMAQEVLTEEQTDKTVPVNAWGVQSDNTPNNLGWNLVGNPYLNYYKTADEYSPLAGLPLIHYIDTDPVTGKWNYEYSGGVPYVATPIDGGWYEYRQELASEVNLMPFTAYFVQVGDPNTHKENGQALNASFEASNRGKKSIVRRAPREVEEIEEPIIVRVELTNSKGESDKTSLVIDDRFTNEYEMNGDFFKWFGDYYNYYTKPVLYTIGADQGKRAFNALNEELAKQPIPMGMYAAQAGNYTFSLNQQFDLSRVEEVWLYDATQSTYTNLMQSDYTFSTSKVNGAGRFSLSVKLAPKVATSIDNVTADKVWATTHTKQVIVNGLENGMHLWLYDATGKLLYNEPTSNYQHTYSVPQTGTYFVSVMKGNAKQTIKVVVE